MGRDSARRSRWLQVGAAPLAVVKQYIENQQTSERLKEREKWSSYLENLA